METAVCSTSYQYEIQMLSAVAEACKSAPVEVWHANVLVTSPDFPLICTPHCFSLITFRFFLLSQSVRDVQLEASLVSLLAVFLSFFSSPWTFVNYYVFIQTAIHLLDSVIYGFLTSFHRSIDNPNQFHIFLLIFLHFNLGSRLIFFLLLTFFSSFLFHKVETFFFSQSLSHGLVWSCVFIKFIFKKSKQLHLKRM